MSGMSDERLAEMRTFLRCFRDTVVHGHRTAADELLAEVDRLRAELRHAEEGAARADALAILLEGAREGLARSGSRAKGVQQVQDNLREPVVRHAIEVARANIRRARPRDDRGKAAAEALSQRVESDRQQWSGDTELLLSGSRPTSQRTVSEVGRSKSASTDGDEQ